MRFASGSKSKSGDEQEVATLRCFRLRPSPNITGSLVGRVPLFEVIAHLQHGPRPALEKNLGPRGYPEGYSGWQRNSVAP